MKKSVYLGILCLIGCLLASGANGQEIVYPLPEPVFVEPLPIPPAPKTEKKDDKKKAEPKKDAKKKAAPKKDEPRILAPCQKKCSKCGKKVCQVEYKMEKVKKTVYEIECKDVCIPGVRLVPKMQFRCKGCGKCKLFGKCKCPPTPSCGPGCGCEKPRCGRVRTVKVLRKKQIECDVCQCKWNIKTCPEPCEGCVEPCPGGCAHDQGVILAPHGAEVGHPVPLTQPQPIPSTSYPPLPPSGQPLPVQPTPVRPTLPVMPPASNGTTPTMSRSPYMPPLLR